MFIAILQHTPVWVWLLLAGLLALGYSQTRRREATLQRITILPVAMTALSLYGVLGAFGSSPLSLGAWAIGAAVVFVLRRNATPPAGAAWSAERGRLQLPGSWVPMALIVGLFLVKYVAGVTMAFHPELAADPRFAGTLSLAYGIASGIFITRALALRGLATGSGGLLSA